MVKARATASRKADMGNYHKNKNKVHFTTKILYMCQSMLMYLSDASLGWYDYRFCLKSKKPPHDPDTVCIYIFKFYLNIHDLQLDTMGYVIVIASSPFFISIFPKCTAFHFYPTNKHNRNDFCYWHFFGVVHLHFLPSPSPFTIIVIMDLLPTSVFMLVSKLKLTPFTFLPPFPLLLLFLNYCFHISSSK